MQRRQRHSVPFHAREVFEYDALSGNLSCASCNPTGQRPLGPSHLTLIEGHSQNPFAQPNNLPDEGEGRLFFESYDNLSAADRNGAFQDVYEWRPDGVGGALCRKAA